MGKLKNALKRIKWFIMDVDGVLTNGQIVYDSEGRELKFFNVRDGMGITLLHKAGIKTAIITSRVSPMVEKRGKELGINEIIQGAKNKLVLYEKLKEKYSFTDEEVLYIGDDYVDAPVLQKVGFPATVPDAPKEVKDICVYITRQKGGEGAVRELAEILLEAQDKKKAVLKEYLGGKG